MNFTSMEELKHHIANNKLKKEAGRLEYTLSLLVNEPRTTPEKASLFITHLNSLLFNFYENTGKSMEELFEQELSSIKNNN